MVQITWTTTHGDTNTRTAHPNDVPIIIDDLQQSGIVTRIKVTRQGKPHDPPHRDLHRPDP